MSRPTSARRKAGPPAWRQVTKRTAWCLALPPLLGVAVRDRKLVVASAPLALTSVLYHEWGWGWGRWRAPWLALDRLAIAWATLHFFRSARRRRGKPRHLWRELWGAAAAAYLLAFRWPRAHGACHLLAATAGLYAAYVRRRRPI